MTVKNVAVPIPNDRSEMGGEREALVHIPDEPRACVLVLHGMAEHKERYRELSEIIAAAGCVAVVYDHAGHGVSLPDERRTGLLATKDGDRDVVETVSAVTDWLQQQFPELPCILLGHSFGSLVARAVMREDGARYAGFVFCGTAATPGLKGVIGRLIASLSATIRGPASRSPRLLALTTAGYNRRIHEPQTEFDWLSRDRDAVNAYINDPASGFTPSAGFFRDLARLVLRVNSRRYLKQGLPDRPVLLLLGGEDPVGGWGAANQRVKQLLEEAGVSHVTSRVYDGARHELFHETNRREVFRDLKNWLLQRVVGGAETRSAQRTRVVG
ncbi:MAG: alpha/beta fold hydrolase [Spirochaetales bacterium]